MQAGRSVAENPQKSSISEGGIILTYRGHDATRVVHGDTSVCSTMCVCVCVWSSFHNGFFPSFCEAKAGQQGSRTGSVSLASWDGAAATEEEAARRWHMAEWNVGLPARSLSLSLSSVASQFDPRRNNLSLLSLHSGFLGGVCLEIILDGRYRALLSQLHTIFNYSCC